MTRLSLIPLIVALAAGCSFDRRSGAFRCDNGEPCGADRVCQDGWCVPANQSPDGGDGDGDGDGGGTDGSSVCPAVCSQCNGDLCLVDCTTAGDCAAQVMCPGGFRCHVECGASSCAAGIDCSMATSCEIECPDDQACAGAITCGPGSCRVECLGTNSCAGGIDCSGSCACDTFCSGAGACDTSPTCIRPMCRNGKDCTSVTGTCDEC